MSHFLVFGTHPRLSLAEFRALKPTVMSPTLCSASALVDDPNWDGAALMNQLGGTVKLGEIIAEFSHEECSPEAVADAISDRLNHPSIDFGWTVFGGSKQSHTRLSKLAIPFKKELKHRGISSRWVTGEHGSPLSPAAVAKLKLTTEGLDICLLAHGETVSVGLTTDVQDADAWSKRDYDRPMRDDKNGMLPPKLARMMVNLAAAQKNSTLADPFCGSGTILMEAALATHAQKIIGSDLEAKQIRDTEQNLAWLIKERVLRPDDEERFTTFTSDVRKLSAHVQPNSIDCVVTEGYLGPPLRGHEEQSALAKTAEQITALWKETLASLHPLLTENAVVVGIWPAFKTAHGTARVDLTPHLAALGYELVDPLGNWETSQGPLIYQRPDQKVSRRIVVLKKV